MEEKVRKMPVIHFIQQISNNNAGLLILEITESAEEMLIQFGKFDIYAEDYSKINSEKRKSEFLGVRLALKALLGEFFLISYNVEGKPFLTDKGFNISISHSGKWIVVMAHRSRLVGVDIECPSDKIQKIYKRFLSETEQEELSQGKNSKQLQIAWSVKEALYKIVGKQAVDFATQLYIYPFETKIEGEIIAKHVLSNTIYKLYYIQNKDYTLVYCLV